MAGRTIFLLIIPLMDAIINGSEIALRAYHTILRPALNEERDLTLDELSALEGVLSDLDSVAFRQEPNSLEVDLRNVY